MNKHGGFLDSLTTRQ